MELRVGGKYRTRDGECVTITSELTQQQYPFIGDSGYSYQIDGTWYVPDGDTEHDLVEEVLDTPPQLASLTAQEIIPPCRRPQAVTCYVTLRDTPDIEPLPSNTYAHVHKCGSLEVLMDDETEKQVALFAPNSWVAYVNKETK